MVWLLAAPCLALPLLASAQPAVTPALHGAVPTAEQVEFFERRIRPLLAESCYGCHSGRQKKPLGGLRVDGRARLLRGGEHGAAVVPGEPDRSLLMRAVRYEEPKLAMPPQGRLPAEKINLLADWIRMGVPWPAEAGPAAA